MTNMQTETDSSIAVRLQKLAQLYQQQQGSQLMTRTLDKLMQYEATVSREQLAQLHDDLSRYEQQYGLSSVAFYRRYQAGETDDRMDYVEWASLIQMVHNLESRLKLLTSD